jgi:hypothetical protein
VTLAKPARYVFSCSRNAAVISSTHNVTLNVLSVLLQTPATSRPVGLGARQITASTLEEHTVTDNTAYAVSYTSFSSEARKDVFKYSVTSKPIFILPNYQHLNACCKPNLPSLNMLENLIWL